MSAGGERPHVALTDFEGTKLLEGLGMSADLVRRVTDFRIVADAGAVMRVEVSFTLQDTDVGLVGEALAEYELRRRG